MSEGSFWERHATKIIAGALVLAAVLIAYNIAHAATAGTVSWSHPTAYIDGSPLAVAEIKETLVIWRRPGSSATAGSVRVAAPAASTSVSGLVCGNFNFSAITVLKTNDVQSQEGGPVLFATGVQCAPNPPTGLKVE